MQNLAARFSISRTVSGFKEKQIYLKKFRWSSGNGKSAVRKKTAASQVTNRFFSDKIYTVKQCI